MRWNKRFWAKVLGFRNAKDMNKESQAGSALRRMVPEKCKQTNKTETTKAESEFFFFFCTFVFEGHIQVPDIRRSRKKDTQR